MEVAGERSVWIAQAVTPDPDPDKRQKTKLNKIKIIKIVPALSMRHYKKAEYKPDLLVKNRFMNI